MASSIPLSKMSSATLDSAQTGFRHFCSNCNNRNDILHCSCFLASNSMACRLPLPQVCVDQARPPIDPFSAPMPQFDVSQSDPDPTVAFQSNLFDDVAKCITIGNDASDVTDANIGTLMTTSGVGRGEVDSDFNFQGSLCNSALHLDASPLKFNSRQLRYHQRHHPETLASPNSDVMSSKIKNKSRFSATGAFGKGTVIRDCKMSLSSLPSSSRCGSLGEYSRFLPISAPRQLASTTSLRYSPIIPSQSLSPVSFYHPSTPNTELSSVKSLYEDRSPLTSTTCMSSAHYKSTPQSSHSGRPMKRLKRTNDSSDNNEISVFDNSDHLGGSKLPKTSLTARKTCRRKKGSVKKRDCKNVETTPSISPEVPLKPFVILKKLVEAPPINDEDRSSEHKGYFLRSRVKLENAKQKVEVTKKPKQLPKAVINVQPKYRTRGQKRKFDNDSSLHAATKLAAPPIQPPTASPHAQLRPSSTRNIASKLAAKDNHLPSTSVGVHVPRLPQTKRAQRLVSRKALSSFSQLYDIKGKIGGGGGGDVFAGTRKSDNVEVAIKKVKKAQIRRWGKLDGRVVPLEFELLHRAGRYGNKAIIQMHDWFERKNSYVLVMERPQPVLDLFDYLSQQGAMSESFARKIFKQLVEGVMNCHANGVVHRDIKDENVVLNLHTGEAKLIDFGCGTFLKNVPSTDFAGTMEFYPPEWFLHRQYEGRKLDAWALGVLFYTMVEAVVPFQNSTAIVGSSLSFKRLKGPASALCRSLITRMLHKDPKSRLSLPEILKHSWMTNESLGNERSSAKSASLDTSESTSCYSDSFNMSSGRSLYSNDSTGGFDDSTRDPEYVPSTPSRSIRIASSPESPPEAEKRSYPPVKVVEVV